MCSLCYNFLFLHGACTAVIIKIAFIYSLPEFCFLYFLSLILSLNLLFFVACINFTNLSEHCGTLGTMSNLNANPIAELNLAPVHETSGDSVQTKNEHNISLVATAQEPHNNSNTDAQPAASINQINNKTFSNGHLLNGLHNSDLNTMVVDINEVNAKQNSPENNKSESLTNGSFKFACQSVHVHDQTKNSAVLAPVIHKNFENLYKFNCIENIPVIEINNENESHGIVNNNNEDMIELTGEPEHVSFNMSSELPTIAESEDSSMSSKSLEKNGEHNFCVIL